jgi:pyruvate dehydrogenase E1 component alpha subunit
MSDPAKYRTREELESYRNQDPILILKSIMMDQNVLDEKEYEEIDTSIKKQCEESVTFAEESPVPSEEQLYQDVFA